eukprot:209356_1
MTGVPGNAWTITVTQRKSYEHWFAQADVGKDGFIDGKEARLFFRSRVIAPQKMKQVWVLSDIDTDGRLSPAEFCVAMHLVHAVRNGAEIPKLLPDELGEFLRSYSTSKPTSTTVPTISDSNTNSMKSADSPRKSQKIRKITEKSSPSSNSVPARPSPKKATVSLKTAPVPADKYTIRAELIAKFREIQKSLKFTDSELNDFCLSALGVVTKQKFVQKSDQHKVQVISRAKLLKEDTGESKHDVVSMLDDLSSAFPSPTNKSQFTTPTKKSATSSSKQTPPSKSDSPRFSSRGSAARAASLKSKAFPSPTNKSQFTTPTKKSHRNPIALGLVLADRL